MENNLTPKKALEELAEYKALESKLGCTFEELFADNVFNDTATGLQIVNNLVNKINTLKETKSKKEQALEIIRTKQLDLNYLIEEYFRKDFCYSDYVECYDDDYDFLTQEEYDLLKEVLK